MHTVKEIYYESQIESSLMTCFAFLPDGGVIAGDSDGYLQIFDTAGSKATVIPGHEGPVRVIAVAHGCIFSAGADKCIFVRHLNAPSVVVARLPSDALVSGIFTLEKIVVCWDAAGGLTYISGDHIISKKASDIPAKENWGFLVADSDCERIVIWDTERIVIVDGDPEALLVTIQLTDAIPTGEKVEKIRSCHLGPDGLVVACDKHLYSCDWKHPLHRTKIGLFRTETDVALFMRSMMEMSPGFTSAMESACIDALTSVTRDELSQPIRPNGCARKISAPWGFRAFHLVLPSGVEVKDGSGKTIFNGGLSQWDASLEGFFPLPIQGAGLVWGGSTIRALSQAVTTGGGDEATPFWELELAYDLDPNVILVEGDRLLLCGRRQMLELGLQDLCEAANQHVEYVETVNTSSPIMAWRMEDPTRCLVPLGTGRLLLVSEGKIEELPFKGLYWNGGFCVLGNRIIKWHYSQLSLIDLESPEEPRARLVLKVPTAVSNEELEGNLSHWAGVFVNAYGDGFIAIQKSGFVYCITESGEVTLANQLDGAVSSAFGTLDGLVVRMITDEEWECSRDGQNLKRTQAASKRRVPPKYDYSLSFTGWELVSLGEDDLCHGVGVFEGDALVWNMRTRDWVLPLTLLASGHVVIREGDSMKVIEMKTNKLGVELPMEPDPLRKSASFKLRFTSCKQIDGIP